MVECDVEYVTEKEEEQELSEAFKSTIGLTAFEQERLDRLAKDKHGTVENFAFEKFAGKYFRKGFKAKFSAETLPQPILNTDDRLNIKVKLGSTNSRRYRRCRCRCYLVILTAVCLGTVSCVNRHVVVSCLLTVRCSFF